MGNFEELIERLEIVDHGSLYGLGAQGGHIGNEVLGFRSEVTLNLGQGGLLIAKIGVVEIGEHDVAGTANVGELDNGHDDGEDYEGNDEFG